MAYICFSAPILPGKLDRMKNLAGESAAKWGPDAHRESRVRLGITSERAFHQSTPMGDFAVALLEGADPAASMATLAASTHPYDVWFKEWVKDIHGIDFSQAQGPPATQVFDLGNVKA